MGRKLNIFTGIIFLFVGMALIANVFISYSLPGGFFGMVLVGLAIYLFTISGKPKGTLRNVPAAGVKCSNCGNLTGSLNSFCPHCGSKMNL